MRQHPPVQSYICFYLFFNEVLILDSLFIDRLQLTTNDLASLAHHKRPPRHRQGEHFLKGPVPWLWIAAAMKLPGRAWHVATILWYLAGLNKSNEIKMQYKLASASGLKRDVVRRGLKLLENANLISVERHPGRSPVVTLLERADHLQT